jgi:hypothetical protein
MTSRPARMLAPILLATLIAAGCGHDKSPPPTTSTNAAASTSAVAAPDRLPDLDPTTVDTSNPDAVATAVVDTAYTMLPRVDESPNDAIVRAAPLLDQKMADAARAFRPATGAGAEWNNWVQQNAFVSAKSTVGTQTCPADTDITALRYVSVVQVAQTPTRIVSTRTLTLLVTMVKTPDTSWRVSTLKQL